MGPAAVVTPEPGSEAERIVRDLRASLALAPEGSPAAMMIKAELARREGSPSQERSGAAG